MSRAVIRLNQSVPPNSHRNIITSYLRRKKQTINNLSSPFLRGNEGQTNSAFPPNLVPGRPAGPGSAVS